METARKRIQKLRRTAYLHSEKILSDQPACVWLSLAGMKIVVPNPGGRREAYRPAIATLQHEIAVRDFLTAFRKNEIGIIETWSIDSNGIGFGKGQHRVKPDGFFTARIKSESRHLFFEIDLGSEPLHRLTRRILAYRQFFKCGGFAERLGISAHEFKKHPFRVLTIFTSERRQKDFLANLEAEGLRNFVLAAPIETACSDPFGRIWTNCRGESGLRWHSQEPDSPLVKTLGLRSEPQASGTAVWKPPHS